MAETLRLPYSVQGNGTVESIGNHLYRVCGPARMHRRDGAQQRPLPES